MAAAHRRHHGFSSLRIVSHQQRRILQKLHQHQLQ
jgi:beta-lactamase class D